MSKSLSELAQIEYGASPREIRAGDVTAIGIYGTSGHLGYATRSLFKGPLVVVARKGTLDKPVFVDKDCWVIDTAFAVLPEKNIDAKWLYYQLSNYDLKKLNESTGVPSISRDYLYRVQFEFQEIAEQQKIACILSTVDEVIERTEAAIAKYKAIKLGMMRDLFTRGIDLETGKLRPKYEDAPALYKQTELGWVPREWEVNPLIEHLQFISYGFTNPMPTTEDGPYMITAADISNGQIQYESARHTSEVAFGLLSDKSRPIKDDMLITKDGTLGRIAVVSSEGICINQSVAILRFKNKSAIPFYKHYLESPETQERILFDAGGSTIKHIYITKIDKMPVICPSYQEYSKITAMLSNINALINSEESILYKFSQTKKALMSALLTGQIRVETDAH